MLTLRGLEQHAHRRNRYVCIYIYIYMYTLYFVEEEENKNMSIENTYVALASCCCRAADRPNSPRFAVSSRARSSLPAISVWTGAEWSPGRNCHPRTIPVGNVKRLNVLFLSLCRFEHPTKIRLSSGFAARLSP